MNNIHKANNNCFLIVGDIHGYYKEFCHFLTKQKNITNANIIICGDFGIGFHKINYYITIFNKINKPLKNNNIHIYAFRGNHDDPKYFSDNDLREAVLKSTTQIHIVDDYDIIKNDEHTILCIGGARSVDKSDRWKWDNVTQKQIPYGWWEGEMIKDIPDTFDKFICENNLNIDTICTHSSPEFCEPLSKSGLEFWSKYDETLIEDCDNERKLLANIYDKLKDKHEIKQWFYGHFHNSYTLINNNVLFRGLDLFDGFNKCDIYSLY